MIVWFTGPLIITLLGEFQPIFISTQSSASPTIGTDSLYRIPLYYSVRSDARIPMNLKRPTPAFYRPLYTAYIFSSPPPATSYIRPIRQKANSNFITKPSTAFRYAVLRIWARNFHPYNLVIRFIRRAFPTE